MKIRVVLASFLSITLFITGCETTQSQFIVMVDTIGGAKADKNLYILLPGNKDINTEDLQFKEYADYVNRSLVNQGFIPAESFEKANVAIYLVYGIGEPKESQYSYTLPTWGETGVSSSYSSGTISSYGGYGSYSGTTTYTPTYGVTGSTTYNGSDITYFRFMILDAVDLNEYKKSKKEVHLWKTTVTSTGSSGDLRLIFPVLIAASQQYVGKNTVHKIEVNMFEDDEQILQIKGIVKSTKTNMAKPKISHY